MQFIFLYLCLLSHPCSVYASIGVFVCTRMWACFHVSVCVVCVYENVSPDLRRQCFSVLGRITLPVTNSDTFARKLYLPRNTKYGRICHKAPIIPPPLHQVQTGNAASQTLGKAAIRSV